MYVHTHAVVHRSLRNLWKSSNAVWISWRTRPQTKTPSFKELSPESPPKALGAVWCADGGVGIPEPACQKAALPNPALWAGALGIRTGSFPAAALTDAHKLSGLT